MTRQRFAGGLLLLLALLLPGSASGQDSRGAHHTINPTQAMTKSPGGPKLGDLFINAPVDVKEIKGDWALVSMEGWVRTNALRKGAPGGAGIGAQASDILVIDHYSTKRVAEGLPQPRVYVTLTLKNKSNTPISSWEALLVAQSKGKSAVVFREPVSDSAKVIQPGASVDVTFFWEATENPYDSLRNATPDTLTLELYRVVVK